MVKYWRVIVASFVVALVMVCCVWGGIGFPNRGGWREVSISTIQQEYHVVVLARPGDAWPMSQPSGMSIWITGEFDGEVEIWTDGLPHQRLSGKVDWQVKHDYFREKCLISYRPITATRGQLTIHYEFH